MDDTTTSEYGQAEESAPRFVPTRSWQHLIIPLIAAGFLFGWLPAAADSPPDSTRNRTLTESERDSLRDEMRQYSRLLNSLRDSLTSAERKGALDEIRGEELIDQALEELGGAISDLSRELSTLDLTIDNNTISLRDRNGEGIEINIPEDLDEQISRGIEAITSAILEELPDTISFEPDNWKNWEDWDDAKDWGRLFSGDEPRRKRRVTGGNMVRVWDDVLIKDDEEIRGDVIVIFGDAVISGRVHGNVINVLGDVELDETSEVTGKVIVIGRLDQDEDAEVGESVKVFRPPFSSHELGNVQDLFGVGWVAFLIKQLEFILMALLTLLIIAVFPQRRLASIENALRSHPGQSFGYGLLLTIAGHIALVVLFGVLVLTVIGIPVALLLLLAYLGVCLLALAIVALQIGRQACAVLHLPWTQKGVLVLVGLFLLHAVTLLGSIIGLSSMLRPLAFLLGLLGLGVKIFAYVYGIGALAVSRIGTNESPALVPDIQESPDSEV
ncbi:MAG: hypothetical protein ABIF77_07260 [bacterium]